MNVRTNTTPYDGVIKQFVISQFPSVTSNVSAEDLVDVLTGIILGTGQTRFGPRPKPEALVAIREVVRDSIGAYKPIPFMSPWGAMKPDTSSIDIAELVALKTFMRFAGEIKELYNPGIEIAVRLEDSSVPFLLSNEDLGDEEELAECVGNYTRDFRKMLEITETDSFVILRPESDTVSVGEFKKKALELYPTMKSALMEYRLGNIEVSTNLLDSLGWRGGFTHETLNYYRGLNMHRHPGKSDGFYDEALVLYFTAAITRRHLGIRGDLPEWEGKFIDFSFAHPVPGTEGYFHRRINRRVVPSRMCKMHIAPWRAKGYLEIDEEDQVKAKLRTY